MMRATLPLPLLVAADARRHRDMPSRSLRAAATKHKKNEMKNYI